MASFREDDDDGVVITFHNNTSITIKINEIRIFKNINFHTLTLIKKDIDNLIPQENSNNKMPIIHFSSIFVRFLPLGLYRCISPISIGGKYQSIWEIWEHIILSFTRI